MRVPPMPPHRPTITREGSAHRRSANQAGAWIPMFRSVVLTMPQSGLSNHNHKTTAETRGTREGMKKSVRKMTVPLTFIFSRMARIIEPSTPRGHAQAR